MSGVAKEYLVRMDADPFRTQPSRDETSNGRGEHSDDNQVDTGTNLECAGRYARNAPRDTDEKPMPAPNARRTRVRAAAATAPATTAAHDTAGLSSTALENSTVSIVSIAIIAPWMNVPPRFN